MDEDVDYAGKRVVVIGPGCDRGALVAGDGEDGRARHHAERSPTYVVARPAQDALAKQVARNCRQKTLPIILIRWRNVLLGLYFSSCAGANPRARKS